MLTRLEIKLFFMTMLDGKMTVLDGAERRTDDGGQIDGSWLVSGDGRIDWDGRETGAERTVPSLDPLKNAALSA